MQVRRCDPLPGFAEHCVVSTRPVSRNHFTNTHSVVAYQHARCGTRCVTASSAAEPPGAWIVALSFGLDDAASLCGSVTALPTGCHFAGNFRFVHLRARIASARLAALAAQIQMTAPPATFQFAADGASNRSFGTVRADIARRLLFRGNTEFHVLGCSSFAPSARRQVSLLPLSTVAKRWWILH